MASNDLLRVRATRTFNGYAAGAQFLLADTDDVRGLIRGGYFEVVAIESPAPVKAEKSTKSTKSKSKSGKKKATVDV